MKSLEHLTTNSSVQGSGKRHGCHPTAGSGGSLAASSCFPTAQSRLMGKMLENGGILASLTVLPELSRLVGDAGDALASGQNSVVKPSCLLTSFTGV